MARLEAFSVELCPFTFGAYAAFACIHPIAQGNRIAFGRRSKTEATTILVGAADSYRQQAGKIGQESPRPGREAYPQPSLGSMQKSAAVPVTIEHTAHKISGEPGARGNTNRFRLSRVNAKREKIGNHTGAVKSKRECRPIVRSTTRATSLPILGIGRSNHGAHLIKQCPFFLVDRESLRFYASVGDNQTKNIRHIWRPGCEEIFAENVASGHAIVPASPQRHTSLYQPVADRGSAHAASCGQRRAGISRKILSSQVVGGCHV